LCGRPANLGRPWFSFFGSVLSLLALNAGNVVASLAPVSAEAGRLIPVEAGRLKRVGTPLIPVEAGRLSYLMPLPLHGA